MLVSQWLRGLANRICTTRRGFRRGSRRFATRSVSSVRRSTAGIESLETRALLVVSIGATNVDALLTDVDGDGLADPGDTLQHTVTITNSGTHGAGAVAANDEGALSFLNLLGSSAITRSTVANTTSGGGAEGVVRIVNTAGTLDRLTIDNSTIFNSTIFNSNSMAGVGDDAMYFESQNSAVMKLTISNSHFTAARADLIQTNALNSSTMDIVVTNTEFRNNKATILSGGGGTLFAGGGTGNTATVTFNIFGNTFRDSRGHAINVFKGTGTANFSGTISNNTVGVAGVANSGTLYSSGDIVPSRWVPGR